MKQLLIGQSGTKDNISSKKETSLRKRILILIKRGGQIISQIKKKSMHLKKNRLDLFRLPGRTYKKALVIKSKCLTQEKGHNLRPNI